MCIIFKTLICKRYFYKLQITVRKAKMKNKEYKMKKNISTKKEQGRKDQYGRRKITIGTSWRTIVIEKGKLRKFGKRTDEKGEKYIKTVKEKQNKRDKV